MSFDKSKDVVVRFGADASGLATGTKAVEAALNDSIRKMEILFDGLHKNVEANTKAVTTAVKRMEDDSDRSFTGMKRSVSLMKNAFRGLMGLLAGGTLIAGVKAFISIADEYTDLESRLKLVTDSTQQLAEVQEGLYEIAKRTRGEYASTVDLYTRFARSTEGINVSQKDLLRVTEAVNKAIVVSGASSDSAKAAIIQLGQGMASGTLRGEELNSVLEQTPRLARMIADGMGVSIGELRKLGAQGKITSEAVFEALKSQAGAVDEEFGQMTDTVSRASEYFSTVWKGVIDGANDSAGSTNSLAESIIALADTIEANREGIINAFVAIADAINWVVERFAALGNAYALFQGMMDGKIGIWDWLTADAEDAKRLLEGIREAGPAKDGAGAASGGTGGSSAAVRPGAGKGKGGGESQVGVWARALDELRVYADESGRLREMSLAEEQAYWEKILRTHAMSAKEREKVESTLSRIKLQIRRQELRTQEDLARQEIKSSEEKGLHEIELQEMTAKQQYELGQIGFQRYHQLQRGFEDRRYEIARQAQLKRIELAKLDPDNPAAVQARYDELERLLRKHNKKVAELNNEAVKEASRKYDALVQGISQGIGNAFGQFAVGMTNFQTFLHSIYRSIQQSFANMIGKMVSDWLMGQTRKLVIQQTTDAASAASSQTSGAITAAAARQTAASTVPATAATAGGKAASAVAGTPIVGPAMAAAAYGSTFAMIMGGLASAESGYDVPAGVNPLAQLHQKEMVLPARYADVIRGMEGNGKGASPQAFNINISAMDAQSVRRLFNQRKTELVSSLREAARNGSHLGMRKT